MVFSTAPLPKERFIVFRALGCLALGFERSTNALTPVQGEAPTGLALSSGHFPPEICLSLCENRPTLIRLLPACRFPATWSVL